MKIIGLDGKVYPWNPVSGRVVVKERSSYHLIARKLIKTLYPSEPLLEEVSLPGTKPVLFADFILPLRKIMLEVHGEQHYNWITHFHPTKRDFLLAQKRDRTKMEWARVNEFHFIELPHWENEIEWRHRILRESKTEI